MTSGSVVVLTLLLATVMWPTVSAAHGKERQFGTKINDPGSPSSAERGSPAFGILVLRGNLNGMERALDEGLDAEARARAARLPRQAFDLIARAKPLKSEEIDQAAGRVAESVARLEGSAAEPGTEAFRAEMSRIRERLAEFEQLLPQDGS